MNQKLVPNFTMVPNFFLDDWLPELSGAEAKLLIFVARKTYGWQKHSDMLSYSQMMAGTGMARSTVNTACQTLQEKGLLIAFQSDLPKGSHDGLTRYALNLDAPAPNVPVRKSDMNEYENTTGSGTKILPVPVRKSDTQKKGLQNIDIKEKERSVKPSEPLMQALGSLMKDDTNPQDKASFLSHSDSISEEEREGMDDTDTATLPTPSKGREDAEQGEGGFSKPKPYKLPRRASTTREERAAIEGLYRAFEYEYLQAFHGSFLKEKDEISKHLETLLAASKAGKTPAQMSEATKACIKAYRGTDFTVSVQSVCRNFLNKPKPARTVEKSTMYRAWKEDE